MWSAIGQTRLPLRSRSHTANNAGTSVSAIESQRRRDQAVTVLDFSAKLLRSFCSLGGITAMQYGLERPDVSQ